MGCLENILVSTDGINSTEAQCSSGIGCIGDMTSYPLKVLTGSSTDQSEFSPVVIEIITALFPASVVYSLRQPVDFASIRPIMNVQSVSPRRQSTFEQVLSRPLMIYQRFF